MNPFLVHTTKSFIFLNDFLGELEISYNFSGQVETFLGEIENLGHCENLRDFE
jgi:hypothetical protein